MTDPAQSKGAERLRIIHLVNDLRNAGNGIINMAVDLACAQAARHEVLVLSEGGDFVPLLETFNVAHDHLPRARHLPSLTRSLVRLRRTTEAFQPDIVHCHMMTGAVLASLTKLGSSFRVVTTVHNEYQRWSILMGLGDRCVSVSSAVARSMAGKGIPRRRLAVVHNGTLGGAREALNAAGGARVELNRPSLVSLGAVSQRKGSDVVVKAFTQIASLHPGAHLYFIGNVDWEDPVLIASGSVASERIHFLGFRSNARDYLAAADIFVLASRKDPYPLAVLEAMGQGVPVIATAVDGIPEALANGGGVLVPPDDPERLATELDQLLSNPSARQLASSAAQRNSQRFTVERMARQYEDLYINLLRTRPS